MAFEPIFEVAKLSGKRTLCSSQAVVEARITPPPNVIIAKVLSITCDCTIAPSETFTGEARYNAKVNFHVIFVDGDGGNHSTDHCADFSDKVTCADITATTMPKFAATILDTDTVNVSAMELKLAAVMEVRLDAVVLDSVKHLSGGGDNIYTHEDSLEFCELVASASDKFVVADSLHDLSDSAKVLSSDCCAYISKALCGDNSVVLEGYVVANILIEQEDTLKQICHTMPFTQGIGATGALSDNLVVYDIDVSSCTIVHEIEGDKSRINIEAHLSATVDIMADAAVKATTDAFSLTNELLVVGESLSIHRNKLCACYDDRVEGTVTLDLNLPLADNVLACCGNKVAISNSFCSEGKFTVEGIVSSNIIYYNSDANTKNSIAIQLPFSCTLPCHVTTGDLISAKAIVSRMLVKIRRGNELDIKADIVLNVLISSTESKYIITELNIGEQRELPSNAFSVHIAKSGETLWDLAKALGSTPEVVLLQNPNCTLPTRGGERIIAYRHL